MQSLSVVLLQSDAGLAQSLTASLSTTFHNVRIAGSLDELRHTVARQRADVVVVDMEVASASHVRAITEEFPGIVVVCNHRLADESMWITALEAGAADFCPSSDGTGILQAAARGARPFASAMTA
ncbi:MAG TPA: hypothetical protein VGF08_14300 [Terriglobales bacterium]|jgi:DNA-binding NtrC family response regulator